MIRYILQVCRAAEVFRLAKQEFRSCEALAAKARSVKAARQVREARRRVEEARLSLHELCRL